MPAYAGQVPPYYPLVLLSHWAPLWLIYSGMTVALMLAAGYGMWRFLKDVLALPPDACLLGGLLFALSSQVQDESIIHVVFNYAFPLFFLWTAARPAADRRARWTAGLGVLSLAAVSYPVLTIPFFSALHLALVLAFPLEGVSQARRLRDWALVWAGYALLFSPQIYALHEYSHVTSRTYPPSATGFWERLAWTLTSFASRSLSVFLLGGAVAASFRSRRAAKLLLLALAFAAASAFFYSSASNFLQGTLLSKMDLGHYMWALNFLMVAAAAAGLADAGGEGRAVRRYVAGGLAAVALAALAAEGPRDRMLLPAQLAVGGAAFLYARRRQGPGYRRGLGWALCLALTAVAVRGYRAWYMEHHPYTRYFGLKAPLAEALARPSGSPGRAGHLGMAPAAAAAAGAEIADGRAPIFYGPYKRVIGAAVAGQFRTEEQRRFFEEYWYNLNILNGQAAAEFRSEPDPALGLNLPLLQALNLTHLVSARPVPALERSARSAVALESAIGRRWPAPLRHVFSPLPLYVYELEGSSERAVWAGAAEFMEGEADVLSALAARPQDLARRVLFRRGDAHAAPESLKGDGAGGSVRLRSYGPDRLAFKLVAEGRGFLVVSNNFDPKWRARVNGALAPVYRANAAFQAVWVPSRGEHDVELEFEDPTLWRLHGAALLGAVLIPAVAVRRRREEDEEGSSGRRGGGA